MLVTLLTIIYWILQIYLYYMLFVIILSWIPGIEETRFYRFLRRGTDWYIGRFRGVIVIGILDFTPMIGFLILEGALWGIQYLISFLLF